MATPLEIACAAAAAGADILTRRAGELGTVRTKSSATDYVTEADIAAGVAVAREIARLDSLTPILVEEPEVVDIVGCCRGELADARVWVVDPLDGTTSYIHGFPCFSVSVALLEDGVPVAGAVHNAASGDRFAAAMGCGSSLNDEPIAVSDTESLHDSLLVTGFPYDRGEPLERQLHVLGHMLRSGAQGVRRDGSAAIDMTHVASGRADGFWEYALQPWDTAAGVVIVREAGGVVTATDGSPWRPDRGLGVVAANPQLHPILLAAIAQAEHDRLSRE